MKLSYFARTSLLLSIDGTDRQTDRRTPDRYLDPAPHTVHAASITGNGSQLRPIHLAIGSKKRCLSPVWSQAEMLLAKCEAESGKASKIRQNQSKTKLDECVST